MNFLINRLYLLLLLQRRRPTSGRSLGGGGRAGGMLKEAEMEENDSGNARFRIAARVLKPLLQKYGHSLKYHSEIITF